MGGGYPGTGTGYWVPGTGCGVGTGYGYWYYAGLHGTVFGLYWPVALYWPVLARIGRYLPVFANLPVFGLELA